MSKEMKVGIFFILGLVILGVLTFYAGGIEDWLKKRYTLRAYFERVDGLDVEDVVTLAGVEVGKVTARQCEVERMHAHTITATVRTERYSE